MPDTPKIAKLPVSPELAPARPGLPAALRERGPSRFLVTLRRYWKAVSVTALAGAIAALWRALPDPQPSLESPSKKGEPFSSVATIENKGWFSARDVEASVVLLQVTDASKNSFEDSPMRGSHWKTRELAGGAKHHMRSGIEMHIPIRSAEVAVFVRYRFLLWHPHRCQAYFGDQGDDWRWREISCADHIDRIDALLSDERP
jgi:hypothetical protein